MVGISDTRLGEPVDGGIYLGDHGGERRDLWADAAGAVGGRRPRELARGLFRRRDGGSAGGGGRMVGRPGRGPKATGAAGGVSGWRGGGRQISMRPPPAGRTSPTA